ncbi:MAG: FAD-binding oxidoreductase, partial [Alphaproteobacteria bacterium]|nr:FAD-binding oxidoreductase [Alphaproteobacteria bacterium]
ARGCWYPETGSVTDPGALVARYEAAFRQNDGAVVPGMAADIRREGQGLIITGPGLVARARTVVIAAGARSAPLAAAFGCRVPLTAERGYHRHFAPAPGHALGRPVYDAGGAFVLAPIGGDIRVLTGVELARPDDPPDYTQLEAACAAAPATLPLGPEKAGSTWMGSRPSTPDGLPVIGFAPGARDIVFAYGHGHVGLSLGPVTGEIVADLVTGQTPRFDLAPFSPSRFA